MTILRAVANRVFGPRGESPRPAVLRDDDPDPGLFGPDSVTWRVHGDLSTVIGGLRALFVQSLHPLAMAGVAQHSSYRSDPLGRLDRTAQYVVATTFGTTREAEQAIARVKQVHRRVRGVARDGTPYRAGDPALLSWVHNAEVESFLVAYQRFGPGLSRPDADRYVAEMTRLGARLGANDLPATAADLRAWVRNVPERRVTREARDAARFLLAPPLPLALLPVYGIVATAAISLLPVRDRIALRLPSFPPAEPFVVTPAVRGALAVVSAGLGESPARATARARVGVSA